MTTPSPAPHDFARRVVQLLEEIHPLDRVPRAGFILRGVADPESVSAHTHFVALMALLVLEEHPGKYDRDRVLAMALIHDLAEARLMDIPMPCADAYLSESKHKAEQNIIEDLLEGFPPHLAALHQEFSDAETPEARLLRGLDKAQMMIKILCYEKEHRGNLEEFWHNPKNFRDFNIPEVAAIFDILCKEAGRVRPE